MTTILCYAFGNPRTGTIWDVADRLAAADLNYLHDCVTGLVYVHLDDAAAAALALTEGGLTVDGRMTSLPEADWPSISETFDPIGVDEIDWDPRETWCAGPAPRYTA
jgi:hypothetical protein